jgi:hypothetical protein
MKEDRISSNTHVPIANVCTVLGFMKWSPFKGPNLATDRATCPAARQSCQNTNGINILVRFMYAW